MNPTIGTYVNNSNPKIWVKSRCQFDEVTQLWWSLHLEISAVGTDVLKLTEGLLQRTHLQLKPAE